MEADIRSIYTCWNAVDREGVMGAFRALGPAGFTVEYVGNDPIDGTKAVDDMWSQYAGTCSTDIVELLVNGTEAAALIHNNLQTDDGIVTIPSIETYKVQDGVLEVRYFHKTV
jgi:limonene-1,2-epoxide hydrolase